MKNYEEIIDALKAGETLIHNGGGKAMLVDGDFNQEGGDFLYQSCFDYPEKWQIYKEPKWYENIPAGGVLCWATDGINEYIEVVVAYDLNGIQGQNFKTHNSSWNNAKPLTKQEIQVFMDNVPEKL